MPPALLFYAHRFKAMGSPCELQLFARSVQDAERVAAQVVADLARLEARYSRYRDNSLLAAINQVAAVGGEITVDEETAALLDYAAACYAQSDGLFDVTSGVLREVWRFDQPALPNAAQITSLLDRVGWQRLRWQRPVLRFPESGLALDFGGIVKEYAADRAATLCREEGVGHGVVNLGGDIRVIGPRGDGSPWQIGIRHPRQAGGLLRTLAMRGGALASSGDYERCITLNGVRYGHILNPRTGWPVDHLAAVSVVADLCVVAGSIATIAMLKGQEGPAWLRALGVPHVWVDVAGRLGGPLARGPRPR
jgi:thiamine biosynthesis lipoprotein